MSGARCSADVVASVRFSRSNQEAVIGRGQSLLGVSAMSGGDSVLGSAITL
jgi:hypothetical protein